MVRVEVSRSRVNNGGPREVGVEVLAEHSTEGARERIGKVGNDDPKDPL